LKLFHEEKTQCGWYKWLFLKWFHLKDVGTYYVILKTECLYIVPP